MNMRQRRSNDTYMSYCVANGVKVYPIQRHGNWYLVVDNNGKLKTYDKSLGNMYALKGLHLTKPVSKIYERWAKLLEQYEANKKDSDHRSDNQRGYSEKET